MYDYAQKVYRRTNCVKLMRRCYIRRVDIIMVYKYIHSETDGIGSI
jgi:hypothetical protein